MTSKVNSHVYHLRDFAYRFESFILNVNFFVFEILPIIYRCALLHFPNFYHSQLKSKFGVLNINVFAYIFIKHVIKCITSNC